MSRPERARSARLTRAATAVHCLLLTAYCLLLTAYCLLLTAYCSLFTVHCSLFATYCSLSSPLGADQRQELTRLPEQVVCDLLEHVLSGGLGVEHEALRAELGDVLAQEREPAPLAVGHDAGVDHDLACDLTGSRDPAFGLACRVVRGVPQVRRGELVDERLGLCGRPREPEGRRRPPHDRQRDHVHPRPALRAAQLAVDERVGELGARERPDAL